MIEVEEKKNLYRDEFETVFGVKKNIQALRNKVLDLAIQGKLVEQDPRDEPARELLLRIQSEKKKLIKEKIIKTEKPLPVIEKDDIPFVLPESWQWIRMGEIATKIHYGYTASANQSGNAQMLRITDIQNGKVQWDNVPYCTIEDEKINQYKLEENDIVIARTGGTVGKSFLIRDINSVSVFASYLIRIVLTNPELANYVNFYLDSPYYWKEIGIQSKGTGQPNVNAKQLSNIIVPLPPLAEQKRIVEKIETLMKQIDKLEEQLEEKEKLETLIPKAVVDSLSNSQDEEELKKNLALVIENFVDVFQTPESLNELRNVILELAIQGRLVPQKVEENSVDDLLEELMTNKRELIASKRIKNDKIDSVINLKEVPYQLPHTWRWTKVGNLISNNGGASYKKTDLSVASESTVRVFRGGNISDMSYVFKHDDVMLSSEFVKDDTILKKNHLITPAVTSEKHIGKIARIEKNFSDVAAGGFVLMLKPHIDNDIFSKYLLYSMSSASFRNELRGITNKSGQAFYNLSRTKMMELLFPLPPLQEQKRIVAKIESIFAVVDQLEEEMKRRDRIVETMAVI